MIDIINAKTVARYTFNVKCCTIQRLINLLFAYRSDSREGFSFEKLKQRSTTS